MMRIFKWIAPALVLGALALFSGRMVKADDAATTQPSSTSGSIVVTVLGSDGNPVPKARLKLHAAKKKSDANAEGESGKPKALASGKTDDDGKFTFSGLASGEYKVNASLKKAGAKGSGTVNVTDDAPNATITINLEVTDGGNGGATTAPSQK
ncbi:MAG TPA: carboxypeptidase-like regulatory domain-containing protein [Tepidisphaeraceae bacterium]|nr:carboxypeptidase-like regulatory domain-containing protein [Tepidisphaeraceae bacterium]